MLRLIIIRGSSGSGKSRFAKALNLLNISEGLPSEICETDDYWKERGIPWSRDTVELAHAWNQRRVEQKMANLLSIEEPEYTIIIPNTLPMLFYIQPYIRMANMYGFVVQISLVERPLDICIKENAYHDMPIGQIKGQKMYTEWMGLDTLIGLSLGATDQFCYDCLSEPCKCKEIK